MKVSLELAEAEEEKAAASIAGAIEAEATAAFAAIPPAKTIHHEGRDVQVAEMMSVVQVHYFIPSP